MKALVTGASGLLGTKVVAELLRKGYEVSSIHHSKPLHPNSIKLDITEKEPVNNLITKIKPEIVIHSAAETNVDRCEKNPEHANHVNVQGTRNIAKASQEIEAKLIYISTDYVFDGRKGNYTEEDQAKPINTYGLTKLLGEQEITKHCKNYLILRSSVNFGWHPHKQNFATWIIQSLRQRKTINIVTDHYNTPTLTNNLAQVISEAIERDLKGLYHASGAERISRYHFAEKIAKKFSLPKSLIKPTKMENLQTSGTWIAKRPHDSSLSTFEIQSEITTKILNIDEALEVMRREEAQLHDSAD